MEYRGIAHYIIIIDRIGVDTLQLQLEIRLLTT
jgi:hypothetical protein